MKRYLSLLLILLFSGSCIDPINLKENGQGGTLVVDGLITDQTGPYTIKLSRTIAYDNSIPLKVYSVPETKAKVSIVDDLGNVEVLTESTPSTPGSYKTKTITGKVGRSYQLFIETSNGNRYHSSQEEMRPTPSIDSVQYAYQISETLFINQNGQPRVQKLETFSIYAVVTDPAVTDNFYRWQVDGIFEYFSITDNSAIKQCWAPLVRLESRVQIASDLYTNGKKFKQYIADVQYDRPTMFLVKVRQQSLSERGYNFWKKISNQQVSTGTIFDPPPASIEGNMVAENGEEEVLGYFGASSIALGSVLFNRWNASGRVTPSRNKLPLNGDCRAHETNGTNIKPEGF